MGCRTAPPTRSTPRELSGVQTRLASLRTTLRPTAGRIADFILENAPQVIHMSITELAEQARASEGSVIGLCKLLGATGFQQLKIVLAQELVQPVQLIHEDLEPDDEPAQIIDKIFASNIQALRDTMTALDPEALQRVIMAMSGAERIELYGIGSAAPIVTVARETSFRTEAMTSRIAQLAIVDALVAGLALSRYEESVATIQRTFEVLSIKRY